MILQPRESPGCLSLVIPCYNEEAVLPLLRNELTKFIPTVGTRIEVILVDDGSTDKTLPFLMGWAGENTAIKIVILARNFGHQNAATAGLSAAEGDAVVLMDADLQDPLSVIPLMLERYKEGYDAVYAQRITRKGESRFKLVSAWLFYRLMKTFIHSNLPPDVGDFRLLSRRCLDTLLSMHEVHRFLRGMITWTGYLQTSISYHRQPRAAGATKYSIWKMFRFASNAIISFSPLPLRISLVVGTILAVTGIFFGLYAAYNTFWYHDTVPGWTSQIIFTAVLGGAILISNGILGEYVGRIFEELKGRPLYVVAERVNFKPKADS